MLIAHSCHQFHLHQLVHQNQLVPAPALVTQEVNDYSGRDVRRIIRMIRINENKDQKEIVKKKKKKVYSKSVEMWIQCEVCENWCHISCAEISEDDIDEFYCCEMCLIKNC